MIIGTHNEFVRHCDSRHNAGKVFRNSFLIAAFENEEADRLRKKGDQKDGDDNGYRPADEKYRLPAKLPDDAGRDPAGDRRAERKTAKHSHDRRVSRSLRHVFGCQGDRIRHRAAHAESGKYSEGRELSNRCCSGREQ